MIRCRHDPAKLAGARPGAGVGVEQVAPPAGPPRTRVLIPGGREVWLVALGTGLVAAACDEKTLDTIVAGPGAGSEPAPLSAARGADAQATVVVALKGAGGLPTPPEDVHWMSLPRSTAFTAEAVLEVTAGADLAFRLRLTPKKGETAEDLRDVASDEVRGVAGAAKVMASVAPDAFGARVLAALGPSLKVALSPDKAGVIVTGKLTEKELGEVLGPRN